ncbi:inositol monophosphatase family protein [Specibacter cremeus]|uniref:inositol monophosphatase family protein n=1 Tax=Specibacter cremeus TaxID=1629051 RepID=UPI001F0C77A1|nr:inositol monophosphatase family protein [Specibacter cremeus]
MPATGTALDPALDPALSDADLAAALVRNAAGLALEMRGRGLSAERKTNVADVVTAADRAAEAYVLGQLRRTRPRDAIVGEEGANAAGSSGRTWVVDPVDGTFNFFSGSSYWCSALALVDGDPDLDADVILGAVHQPQEDRLWLGGRDLPATLNGAPVAVDDRAIDQLSAGTYIHPGWLAQERAAAPWHRAAVLPATLRMLGSGSCDLGRVAQGELGAWFQHSCPPWDFLPGKAIVRAAGGDTAVVRVNELDWFIAGPGAAVHSLAAALRGR